MQQAMNDEGEEKGRSQVPKRKARRDKGLVMATRRDLYCIEWIAEMYAARGDQIQRLLSRFPDEKRPFKNGKLIAETTVKDQLSRWQRAGWVEYRRVLADMPGWAWVAKKGLQLVGLDEIYTARIPASTRLEHLYAVNQLRLSADSRYTWKSERRYRSELIKQKTKKNDTVGPIPDGIITTKDGAIALEVELTAKKPAELAAKLSRLVRHYSRNGLEVELTFPTIWLYVPSERLKALVEEAIEALRDDEQQRVEVVMAQGLVAFRSR